MVKLLDNARNAFVFGTIGGAIATCVYRYNRNVQDPTTAKILPLSTLTAVTGGLMLSNKTSFLGGLAGVTVGVALNNNMPQANIYDVFIRYIFPCAATGALISIMSSSEEVKVAALPILRSMPSAGKGFLIGTCSAIWLTYFITKNYRPEDLRLTTRTSSYFLYGFIAANLVVGTLAGRFCKI